MSMEKVSEYWRYLWSYRSFFIKRVRDDLKGKFRYTIIGYGWHILSPLAQIVMYYVFFTVLFGRTIPHYWAYLSIGMFTYTIFSTTVVSGSGIMISNSSMITKISFPKELLIVSKVTSCLITSFISYLLTIALMIIFGVPITIYILFLPIILLLFYLFTVGIYLITASLTVYIRDLSNALQILGIGLIFSVPIMYEVSQRSTPFFELMWSINPLFYYINAIHDVCYYGIFPDTFTLIVCISMAVISVIVGLLIFKKLELHLVERL